jgi:hypothetical protein
VGRVAPCSRGPARRDVGTLLDGVDPAENRGGSRPNVTARAVSRMAHPAHRATTAARLRRKGGGKAHAERLARGQIEFFLVAVAVAVED